jgi:tetratricopeptide (TPR) repeat protein
MPVFEEIEKEYIEIDPLDKNKLFPFYENNKHYFDSELPEDKEELKKYLCIVSEIGATYSNDKQYKIALSLLNRVLKLYKIHYKELSIDLSKDDAYSSYNSAFSWKAHTLFNTGKYLRARTLLREIVRLRPEDKDYQTLLAICELKIKKRMVNFMGIIGLFIIILEYSIKGFYGHKPLWGNVMVIMGGALLMLYGLSAYWINLKLKK